MTTPTPRRSSNAPVETDRNAGDRAAQRAARAEEAKRSFLRMVSHELRTPLNAIIGFSEILEGELYGPLGTPQYQEYAEIIRVSGQRLLHLVNQVLEVARLQADAADLDVTAEPLGPILDDAVLTVDSEARARGVRIEVTAPASVVALADSRALRTAVVNLLNNAIAFSPEGGQVALTARVAGPLVIVCVVDHGQGLDLAQVPRLMHPFEQGENALVRSHQGAGLGWPIVKLLMEAMGGAFRVETAPGEGLSACLTLRRAG